METVPAAKAQVGSLAGGFSCNWVRHVSNGVRIMPGQYRDRAEDFRESSWQTAVLRNDLQLEGTG